MRIALALVVVLAACKSKSSAPAPEPVTGSPGPENVAPTTPPAPASETSVWKPRKDVVAQQANIVFPDAGGLPSDLPSGVGSDAGSASAPAGVITIANKTSFDRTSLSADAVAAAIMKEHLAALRSCYGGALARDASAKGKAMLALTVKPDGAVTPGKVLAPDTTLASCFGQAMATWKLPVPKDADGEPTEAGFQIELALAPR